MIVRELQTLLSFRADNREAQKWEQGLERMQRLALGLGAALAGAFGIRKIIEAGDAYTTTMNRLGASTTTAEQATQAYEGLYASARETGIAVQDSSKAFMRFSPAMTRLGYNLTDTIALVDGLQKGLLAAGSTAAESASVFQQLGQAINSGVFQGEELGSFLENASPTLVAKFAEALGTTADKLKKMGEDGKLTTSNVLPALIAAARAGRDEFGRMRVTVALAMARSGIAIDRFTAELERAFQFTEKLARVIETAGKKFDEWRAYIPTIQRVVNELGGLEQILASVALGVIYVTAVIAASNGALTAMIARFAVLSAGIMAVVAAGLLLHDFFTWMQGGDTKTLFGEMFGSFQDVIGPYKPGLDELKRQLEEVKTILVGTPDEAAAAWARLKTYLKGFWNDVTAEWPAWAKTAIGIEGDGAAAVAGAGASLIERAREPIAEAYRRDDPSSIGDWFMRELRDVLGALGVRQRVQQPDGSTQLLAPGQSMNDALLRRTGPAGTAVQNNSATVTNNVTVNATGVSGPEVASAAQQGINQVLSTGHWFERLAREGAMANPAFEGRAMGAGQ